MSDDRYFEARRRANMKRAAGKPAEAAAIEAEADRVRTLDRLFEGAKLAGRAQEFENAYRSAMKRRNALGLGGYVPEDDILRELEPFAASSEAWLRRQYSDLSDEEAHAKAEANRRVTAGQVKDRLEGVISDGLEQKDAAGDSTRKRRLVVDTTKDPGKVNPLARTEKGFGKLSGYNENPLSRGFANLRKAMGGSPSERRTKSASQVALRKTIEATERRELEKLRKENLRKLRQEHKLNGKNDSAAERALRELGIEIITPEMQDEARRRAHRIAEQAQHRGGSMLRPRESLRKAYKKAGWKGFLFAIPKSWYAIVLVMAISMVVTMGMALGVATLQAVSVAFANTLSIVLLAINSILAFSFGLVGLGANFVLGIVSGATGFVYDAVWASIGRHVPHAEYAKPVLGLTTVAFPQLAYIGSQLAVDFHDDGSVDYGLPEWVPVDALGEPVDSWLIWRGEFSMPDFSKSVITCNTGQDFCQKSSLARLLESVSGDFVCRLRQTFDDAYVCSKVEA